MADLTYMLNRKQYARPQGMLFSNNPGTLDSGYYVPEGFEFGVYDTSSQRFIEPDWMVLTDDNRKEISLSYDRIEDRKRMINGRMRSIHVADKIKISCSWDMVPSRAFDFPNVSNEGSPYIAAVRDSVTGEWTETTTKAGDYTVFNSWSDVNARFTTDGGAGGADMLLWYKNHPGSFYVFLAYDNFHNFNTSGEDAMWSKLTRYNERVEVFFSDFQYNVVKRGQRFDFWNVSMSLEEA